MQNQGEVNTVPVIYLGGNELDHIGMDVTQIRAAHIRKIVAAVGGPTKFANAFGNGRWSQAQVSQWVSADNPKSIGGRLARDLEQELGLPHGAIDCGPVMPINVDNMDDSEVRRAAAAFIGGNACDDDVDDLRAELRSRLQPWENDVSERAARLAQETLPAQYAYVSRASGPRLSAGTGEVVWDFEEIDRSHAFRRDWMQKARLNPSRCKLFEVRGDSMSPTLNSGDIVMVNMEDRTVVSGEVYALITDDGLRVKRLQRRADGLVWMLSDNPLQHQFPPEPIKSENVAVIGRIVWRGGSLIEPETQPDQSGVKEADVTVIVAKAFSKLGKEWGPGEPEFLRVRAEHIERARRTGKLPSIDDILATVRSG